MRGCDIEYWDVLYAVFRTTLKISYLKVLFGARYDCPDADKASIESQKGR
ncbi:hypothetical protein HMPREF1553_00030 [Porphyromonas gingivalis F0568]|nr:hypothetical protein HMPREF1553_00030 [Porphyromonas gingivalis F0568]